MKVISLLAQKGGVGALETEGFVRRRDDKFDSRSVLISTTAKGKRAYQRATHQSLSHLKGALNTLAPEQLVIIRTMLSALDEQPQSLAPPSEVKRLYAIAPIGLCYFDTELRFRYINEWLARINGLSVEAHLGKTIDELLKDVAAGVVPQLRLVLQTGEPIIDGTVEAATPAHPGESRHFLHSYFPDKSNDGTVVGVSCAVRDITERIGLETGSRPHRRP